MVGVCRLRSMPLFRFCTLCFSRSWPLLHVSFALLSINMLSDEAKHLISSISGSPEMCRRAANEQPSVKKCREICREAIPIDFGGIFRTTESIFSHYVNELFILLINCASLGRPVRAEGSDDED